MRGWHSPIPPQAPHPHGSACRPHDLPVSNLPQQQYAWLTTGSIMGEITGETTSVLPNYRPPPYLRDLAIQHIAHNLQRPLDIVLQGKEPVEGYRPFSFLKSIQL
jgi:hypothetical protein